jgi:endonuclease-8
MPEGDNVLRAATVLGRELTGRTIDRIRLHDRGDIAELAGRRVEKIEARGKHMLVSFDVPWVLRVHLGMNGRWRRLHVREKASVPATIRIEAGEVAYVCLGSYKADLIRSAALRTNPRFARLGPDLLQEPPDIDAAVRRAKQAGNASREIGDVVMDQRIAAGIGNIYKSETLFECRVHPRRLMHRMSEAEVRAVYEKAAALMRLNLLIRNPRIGAPIRRRTNGGTNKRFWVYMRKNKPCFDCGTPIERILQGDMGRSTYFCPKCQRLNDDRVPRP